MEVCDDGGGQGPRARVVSPMDRGRARPALFLQPWPPERPGLEADRLRVAVLPILALGDRRLPHHRLDEQAVGVPVAQLHAGRRSSPGPRSRDRARRPAPAARGPDGPGGSRTGRPRGRRARWPGPATRRARSLRAGPSVLTIRLTRPASPISSTAWRSRAAHGGRRSARGAPDGGPGGRRSRERRSPRSPAPLRRRAPPGSRCRARTWRRSGGASRPRARLPSETTRGASASPWGSRSPVATRVEAEHVVARDPEVHSAGQWVPRPHAARSPSGRRSRYEGDRRRRAPGRRRAGSARESPARPGSRRGAPRSGGRARGRSAVRRRGPLRGPISHRPRRSRARPRSASRNDSKASAKRRRSLKYKADTTTIASSGQGEDGKGQRREVGSAQPLRRHPDRTRGPGCQARPDAVGDQQERGEDAEDERQDHGAGP